MNVLGQFAATAANASLLANHIGVMWLLGNGHVFSPVETLLAYASEGVLHCCVLFYRGAIAFLHSAGGNLVRCLSAVLRASRSACFGLACSRLSNALPLAAWHQAQQSSMRESTGSLTSELLLLLLRCAVILVLAGSVSSVSTSGVRLYSILAGIFLIVSGLFVVILLPILAPVHQSAAFVFFQFDASDLVCPPSLHACMHACTPLPLPIRAARALRRRRLKDLASQARGGGSPGVRPGFPQHMHGCRRTPRACPTWCTSSWWACSWRRAPSSALKRALSPPCFLARHPCSIRRLQWLLDAPGCACKCNPWLFLSCQGVSSRSSQTRGRGARGAQQA